MIQIGNQVERVSVDRLETVPPVNAIPSSATQIPLGHAADLPPTADQLPSTPELNSPPPSRRITRSMSRNALQNETKKLELRSHTKKKRVRFADPLSPAVNVSPVKLSQGEPIGLQIHTPHSWLPTSDDTEDDITDQDIATEIRPIDRICAHLPRDEKQPGCYRYLARWYESPDEDSWEPFEHLPRSVVISYDNRRQLQLPLDLSCAEIG